MPEVEHVQAYAGTSAPFTFNGLVRHYFLRGQPEQGDLQVNLPSRHERDRASHAIALDVRELLSGLDVPDGTVIKVAEIPPGPPVLATLLAEVYGADTEVRRRTAQEIRDAFGAVDFIVDIDDSFGQPAERLRFEINQENLDFYQVEEEELYDTIQALLGGVPVGYSHRGELINPIEIAIQMPPSDLFLSERVLATPVPGRRGVVELGDLIMLTRETASYPLYRRDGRFAEMVSGELAGAFEAPIYGMLAVEEVLKDLDLAIRYHGQPEDESSTTLLWDGEWEVTYVTFRDMGAAFGVAIIGIYLLLVGQFRRFTTPLLILTPVPLTLLGIVLGHWLLGAHFTATSMIGFIALAGIVVRNSILLVDFIKAKLAENTPLRQALLDAGSVRFKPIALTAISTMAGAAFILADPIFQGLAVSLLFGLLSSTLLTVLVIPAVYIWLRS